MITLSSGKREVVVDPPLMNAAGSLGFSNEPNSLVDLAQLGAFVTHPVSPAARAAASGIRLIRFPGGYLLHTGWPNPGFASTVRRERRRWASLPRPVILHLLATEPASVANVVRRAEAVEEIAAIELGLGEADSSLARDLVAAATRGELPVLAHLPLTTSDETIAAAATAGAAAIVLGPPRGTLMTDAGTLVRGRLYGPAILPLAIRAVERACQAVTIPVVGSGGVYAADHVQALLSAGAAAVQLDSILWTEPEKVLTGAD